MSGEGTVGDVPGIVQAECPDTVPEWHKRNLVTLTWRKRKAEKRKILTYNVKKDLKGKSFVLTRSGEATRNRDVWRSLVRAPSMMKEREE